MSDLSLPIRWRWILGLPGAIQECLDGVYASHGVPHQNWPLARPPSFPSLKRPGGNAKAARGAPLSPGVRTTPVAYFRGEVGHSGRPFPMRLYAYCVTHGREIRIVRIADAGLPVQDTHAAYHAPPAMRNKRSISSGSRCGHTQDAYLEAIL
jgi:hypothetical protein